jgi:hypothetical protein
MIIPHSTIYPQFGTEAETKKRSREGLVDPIWFVLNELEFMQIVPALLRSNSYFLPQITACILGTELRDSFSSRGKPILSSPHHKHKLEMSD